jgi:hypothetical protein
MTPIADFLKFHRQLAKFLAPKFDHRPPEVQGIKLYKSVISIILAPGINPAIIVGVTQEPLIRKSQVFYFTRGKGADTAAFWLDIPWEKGRVA